MVQGLAIYVLQKYDQEALKRISQISKNRKRVVDKGDYEDLMKQPEHKDTERLVVKRTEEPLVCSRTVPQLCYNVSCVVICDLTLKS